MPEPGEVGDLVIGRSAVAVFIVLRMLLPDLSARADRMARDAAEWIAAEADLGTQTLNEQGLSDWLSLEVPEGAISFLITVVGRQGTGYGLADLVAPGGDALLRVSAETPAEQRIQKAFPTGNYGVYNYLYPNTSTMAVQPGRYQFRVGSNIPGHEVRVRARFQMATGEPQGGTVRLNVYRVTMFDSIKAVSLDFLPDLNAVYAPAGIAFTVAHAEVIHHPKLATRTMDRPSDQGEDLSALVAGRGGRDAINVFVLDDIDFARSFGVPGPARGDLPSGGIILSAMMVADWGEIVAHEIGHYLGLFHVPDDPLPDTSAAECSECPRNLMEPRSPGVYLSPGQVYVILRHPIVHLK